MSQSDGYRNILISIDLEDQDEHGDELPPDERVWWPTITVKRGEADDDSDLIRESSAGFPSFGDSFVWVFHELALVEIELPFAGPAASAASRFPERLPMLLLPAELQIQGIAAGMLVFNSSISAGEKDFKLEGWTLFADAYRKDGQRRSLGEQFVPAAGVTDAMRNLFKMLETQLPSASTSLTYPRSRSTYAGATLDARYEGDRNDLSRRDISLFTDEKEIEDHFAAHPSQLYENFWLVGQQMLTAESRKADLIGVDDNGSIVVVECKHGTPDRRAFAQAIEYAGFFSEFNFAEMSRHLTSHSTMLPNADDPDFESGYVRRYGPPPRQGPPVRLALVSTDMDEHAIKSIAYLRETGVHLDFFLVTSYDSPDGPVIDIKRNPRLVAPKRWITPPDLNERMLTNWILEEASRLEIGPLYRTLYDMIEECLPYAAWKAREDSGSLGLNRALNRKRIDGERSPGECLTIRINGHSIDRVWILLFDKIIELAPRKTRAFLKRVPHWRDGTLGKSEGCAFELSLDDWEEHRDELHELLTYIGRRWTEKIGR